LNDGRPDVNVDQYRQVQVETSTTLDLVRLAYDGIIENLDKAIDSLNETPVSHDAFNHRMTRAQEIVSALDDGLDENQGELSELLANFYEFIRKRLIECNLDRSLDGIVEVIGIVKQVRDYWSSSSEANQNENSVASEPEMKKGIDIAG